MASDTKTLILDAAETLFAEQGIDAVSLRAITTAAHVNLAAIHYHFGSKEALVKAVFERRIEALNRMRLKELDRYEAEAGDGPLPVENVLRALIEPSIRLSQSHREGRTFMKLCARAYAESAGVMEEIFDDCFPELARRFNAAFVRALPGLDPVELAWRIQFTVGAMLHTMQEGERLKKFSQGRCDPADVEGAIDRMVAYTAAGLKAPPAALPDNAAEPVSGQKGDGRPRKKRREPVSVS